MDCTIRNEEDGLWEFGINARDVGNHDAADQWFTMLIESCAPSVENNDVNLEMRQCHSAEYIDHPDVAAALHNLGIVVQNKRRLDGGII